MMEYVLEIAQIICQFRLKIVINLQYVNVSRKYYIPESLSGKR